MFLIWPPPLSTYLQYKFVVLIPDLTQWIDMMTCFQYDNDIDSDTIRYDYNKYRVYRS